LRLAPFQQASRSAKILGLILLLQALLPLYSVGERSSRELALSAGRLGGWPLYCMLYLPALPHPSPHIGAADTPGYVRLATLLPAAC